MRSPIVVASVGTLSGPASVTIVPVFQGVQVWVQFVNGKGGVNGHPVKLIVYDDGADPARYRAHLQDAVERRHAVAFLGNVAPFTGEAGIEYINAKRVPVVGTSLGETWNYSSPMYFPQASAGHAVLFTGVAAAAQLLIPEGKTNLASLVCVEAQLCRDADRVFSEAAKELGFRHVYRASSSVAQPDYTAECLNARNSGAQVFLMIMDSSAVTRIGNACARQGYRPAFVTVSSIVTDRQKEDPNLEGMVASTPTFPWFQSGTPATDEFQQAMRAVGSIVPPGIGPSTGWTAGKLFERATAKLPEPPTSEAVLKGLWSVKDETLGGITQPLSFVENQPAKPISCWFNLAIQNKTWVSPDGFNLHCRPAPPTTR